MVLGDVEETVTTVEVDEDTYEEIVRVSMVGYFFGKVVVQVFNSCSPWRYSFTRAFWC